MIKTKVIANACCIYEADGFRLISDPWITNGAFEGSWYHPTGLIPDLHDEIFRVDAIFISHLHPDHFDPLTLVKYSKDIPLYILDREPNFLRQKLSRIGFNKVIMLESGVTTKVGPFNLTLHEPFCKHPYDESVLGNLIDTAMVLEKDGYQILNANDNSPDKEAAVKLRKRHGEFSLLQLKYAIAGAYPSCFLNLNEAEKESEKRQLLFKLKTQMDQVGAILGGEIQSFAGSYVLAGTMAYKNKFLAVDGLDLSRVPQGLLYPYETDSSPNPREVEDLVEASRLCMFERQKPFNLFPDYSLAIWCGQRFLSFNLKDAKISISQQANLQCFMDLRLLKRICLKQAHWNNAEIGCHIDFNRVPNVYNPDVSVLMSFFHT